MRAWKPSHENTSSASILSLLTDAAEALAAAHELAVDAGAELPQAVIRRAAVFVASAIDLTTQPVLHTSATTPRDEIAAASIVLDEQGNVIKDRYGLAGVLNPPVKIRERGVGGVL